jgi:arylsulfatase A-like enzyme
LTSAKSAEMIYKTPNLDRLAREGTAFSQAHACPLCSPTRAGLSGDPDLNTTNEGVTIIWLK